MSRQMLFTLFAAASVLLLTACRPAQPTPTPVADMPNPASVHCEQNGGKLEIRTDATGGAAGICVFPDDSECDEWAFYRGECKPGGTLSDTVASDTVASDGCNIYRNEEFGYSFHYPAGTKVNLNDEPLASIFIGPEADGEEWPSITISHPQDREDYRPPEGADLLQWLTDHYLVGDHRSPDVQIAGTTAIHFRQERSPQSYAHDRYYFARGGQLYMLVIGHTADKEDWDFYNHFLESIQF